MTNFSSCNPNQPSAGDHDHYNKSTCANHAVVGISPVPIRLHIDYHSRYKNNSSPKERGRLFLLSKAHTTPALSRRQLTIVSILSPYTSSCPMLVQTIPTVSLCCPPSLFLSYLHPSRLLILMPEILVWHPTGVSNPKGALSSLYSDRYSLVAKVVLCCL